MKNQEFLKDLRLKNIKELQGELKSKQEELFFAKIEHKSGKLKNYKKIGKVRKQIAQTLTIIQEKSDQENHGK